MTSEQSPAHATELPADETSLETGQVTKKKKPETKAKNTFMLHCPSSGKSLAKLCASSDRYAALKCASRIDKLPDNLKLEDGSLRILLRKTNTKVVREFRGRVVTLDVPQEVFRSGRKIVYTKKPVCKYVKKMLWDEAIAGTKDGKAAPPPDEDAPVLK